MHQQVCPLPLWFVAFDVLFLCFKCFCVYILNSCWHWSFIQVFFEWSILCEHIVLHKAHWQHWVHDGLGSSHILSFFTRTFKDIFESVLNGLQLSRQTVKKHKCCVDEISPICLWYSGKQKKIKEDWGSVLTVMHSLHWACLGLCELSFILEWNEVNLMAPWEVRNPFKNFLYIWKILTGNVKNMLF